MGKPTGFIEYLRELPVDRTPTERVRDWNEFHHHMEEKHLRQQGARCMDCGVPFCHTGKLMNGGASGCPVNNLIPEWNDLVYRGLWREALDRLIAARLQPRLAGNVSHARRRWGFVLMLLGLALAIVALAQPQMGFTWEERKQMGYDVIIAVDTSRSMLATDLQPNRLTRAKLAAPPLRKCSVSSVRVR
jgi:glutamate synthase (NADPH/NADH) small chain